MDGKMVVFFRFQRTPSVPKAVPGSLSQPGVCCSPWGLEGPSRAFSPACHQGLHLGAKAGKKMCLWRLIKMIKVEHPQLGLPSHNFIYCFTS